MKKYKVLKECINPIRVELVKEGDIITEDDCCLAKDSILLARMSMEGFVEEIPEQPKTVWDLKDGDGWFYIEPECTGPLIYITHSDKWLSTYRELGLAFLSKIEAKKELARRKAKVILEGDTKGFKPNWRKTEQSKYYVGYSYEQNDFYVGEILSSCELHLHFATRSDAKASIDAHPNEWKAYLGVEE